MAARRDNIKSETRPPWGIILVVNKYQYEALRIRAFRASSLRK
jgi:hypothetical protein